MPISPILYVNIIDHISTSNTTGQGQGVSDLEDLASTLSTCICNWYRPIPRHHDSAHYPGIRSVA